MRGLELSEWTLHACTFVPKAARSEVLQRMDKVEAKQRLLIMKRGGLTATDWSSDPTRLSMLRVRTKELSGQRFRTLAGCVACGPEGRNASLLQESYLVDPASSHMLVSKIKPCMSKYKQFIQRNCEWLIKSVIVYLIVSFYSDNRGNSRANTCLKA